MPKDDEEELNRLTYREGDLELVKEGDGPPLSETQVEAEEDFGRPDPGFRAPRGK